MIYGPGQKRPTSGQSPYLKFLEQNASKWQGVADQVLNPDSTQKSAPRIGQEANLDAAILKGGLATAKQGNTAEWQKYQQPNEGVLKADLSNRIDKYNLNIAGGNDALQKQADDYNYNRVNMDPNDYTQKMANIEKRRGEILDYNKQYTLGNVDKTQQQIARSEYTNNLLGQATGKSDTSPLVAAINSLSAGNGPREQINTRKGELAAQTDVNRPTGAVAQQIANQKAVTDANSAIYKERGDQRVAGKAAADYEITKTLPEIKKSVDFYLKGDKMRPKYGDDRNSDAMAINGLQKQFGLSREEAKSILDNKGKNIEEVLRKSKRTSEGDKPGLLGQGLQATGEFVGSLF